jgi:hypothetical protein
VEVCWVPPDDEEAEEAGRRAQPKRQSVETVPLGIRRPRSPKLDPLCMQDAQHQRDDDRDSEVQRRALEMPLEAPELHRDYEIRDGEEFDRHLEDVCSVNTVKELIARAQEEIADRSGIPSKPFRGHRLDELTVFGKEAILTLGEESGYQALKHRIEDLIVEDIRATEQELDRKKAAYLKNAGR